MKNFIKPGVIFGEDLQKVFDFAKKNKFAFPAVNVIGTNSINAVMEAAKVVNSPIIIQFSNGGGAFNAGKSLSSLESTIAGTVSGAQHIHKMAEHYGIPVILHTDHAARKLLPWINGLLDAGEEYYKTMGKPLFSSHMLDLSEETLEENISTSVFIALKITCSFSKTNIFKFVLPRSTTKFFIMIISMQKYNNPS
jgi:fructose-bisphosphate aldolase class II